MLVSSRQGINASPDQIALLDELLTPLIKKSQSVNHIYGTHREALGISKSTYCNLSLFTFRNIDLPRKARYKQRKKKPKATVGRTYVDFKSYMEAKADTAVVEMDVVESVKGGRVFLTLYFRQTKLMLAFLMEKQTQDCVTEVFDDLENLLGIRAGIQACQHAGILLNRRKAVHLVLLRPHGLFSSKKIKSGINNDVRIPENPPGIKQKVQGTTAKTEVTLTL